MRIQQTERLLGGRTKGHEREQLIFMRPVPSCGGRLGDDGYEAGEGRVEVKSDS